jgi:hypothetical protein
MPLLLLLLPPPLPPFPSPPTPQSLFRMFSVRRRFMSMLGALGRWRMRHSSAIIAALRYYSDLAERVVAFTVETSTSSSWWVVLPISLRVHVGWGGGREGTGACRAL